MEMQRFTLEALREMVADGSLTGEERTEALGEIARRANRLTARVEGPVLRGTLDVD